MNVWIRSKFRNSTLLDSRRCDLVQGHFESFTDEAKGSPKDGILFIEIHKISSEDARRHREGMEKGCFVAREQAEDMIHREIIVFVVSVRTISAAEQGLVGEHAILRARPAGAPIRPSNQPDSVDGTIGRIAGVRRPGRQPLLLLLAPLSTSPPK